MFTHFSCCLISKTCLLVSSTRCLSSKTRCRVSHACACSCSSGHSHQGAHTRGCSSRSRGLAGRRAAAAGALAGTPGPGSSPAGRGRTLGERDPTSDQGAVPHLGVPWAWHWSLSHCALIECPLCACAYWVPIVYMHFLRANCVPGPEAMAGTGHGLTSWGLKDHLLLSLSLVRVPARPPLVV